MNVFDVIKNLYTNNSCNWIKEIDSDVQGRIIQRILVMNDRLRVQVRWLDKYVDLLPTKMFISLAWSIIPKTTNPPFVKYIKQVDEEEEFNFILPQIRKHFKMSDNDFRAVKNRIIKAIKNDMVNWFSYYGIRKAFWKQYQINYNLIKEFGEITKQNTTLANWGL